MRLFFAAFIAIALLAGLSMGGAKMFVCKENPSPFDPALTRSAENWIREIRTRSDSTTETLALMQYADYLERYYIRKDLTAKEPSDKVRAVFFRLNSSHR